MTAKRQSRTRDFAGDLERITLTRRDWAGVTSQQTLQATFKPAPVALSALQATRLHPEAFIRAVRHHVQLSSAHLSRKPFQKKEEEVFLYSSRARPPPEISKRTSKDLQEALCSVFFFHPETFSLFFQTHSLLLFQALMSLHSFHSRTPTADCSVSFGAALGDPSSFSTDSARHLLSALFPCSPRPHHNFLRFSSSPLSLPCLFTASVQLIRSDCRFSLFWGLLWTRTRRQLYFLA